MRKPILLLVALALLAPVPAVQAEPGDDRLALPRFEKAKKVRFLELVRNEQKEPIELRTSVVRFVPFVQDSGVEFVDLVGVIHIGDRDYYERMNELFKIYDVVLFELAHKEDPREKMEQRRRSRRGGGGMFGMDPAKQLGLVNQVEHIDYKAKNFVHADTSLTDAMERRGDDFLSLIAGVFADFQRKGNLDRRRAAKKAAEDRAKGIKPRAKKRAEPADPFGGLFGGMGGGGDPLTKKREMAEQLEAQGLDGLAGLTTINDVLIDERNKVAMERFREQLKLGKKRIAIFYGAAHNRDFTQRLVVDHGLRPDKIAWLRAWDMRESSHRNGTSEGSRRGGGQREAFHDMIDQLFDMLEGNRRDAEKERRGR